MTWKYIPRDCFSYNYHVTNIYLFCYYLIGRTLLRDKGFYQCVLFFYYISIRKGAVTTAHTPLILSGC